MECRQRRVAPLAANRRRLTNIGTFRAYALAYLQNHPDIHPHMTCMVRQLQPTAQGIPLEIYCFTRTTAWVDYERIQGDVFDYLLAVMPEFGLGAYQQPSGQDLRQGRKACSKGVTPGPARSRRWPRRAAATKPPPEPRKTVHETAPDLLRRRQPGRFHRPPDGSVDWLDRFAEGGNDHGYKSFYQGIDGLLMGRGTYDIVRGFGDWPYPGKPCQVLTRNPQESAAEGVELRHVTPQEGLARLGEQGCRRIWLAGGGSLAGSCLAAGLLDEVIVSVIPQLLGAGIPLFAGGRERRLQLLEQHGYNSGIVQMRYQVIAEDDPQ